jgi:osmotically-inducible protein OsmY
MRPVIIITLVFLLLLGAMADVSCTPKMDQNIKERTDLGLDTLTKARDRGQDIAVLQNIQSDLVLRFYSQKGLIQASVSHAVATITGKVKTQEQKDLAGQLAKQTTGIKEVINELEIDPELEDPPFEW